MFKNEQQCFITCCEFFEKLASEMFVVDLFISRIILGFIISFREKIGCKM